MVPAPGLRHLILVGEFGCQGNRASGTADELKYIFYEMVQNAGRQVKDSITVAVPWQDLVVGGFSSPTPPPPPPPTTGHEV